MDMKERAPASSRSKVGFALLDALARVGRAR
jgi:hypothetical protein